jgi:drug/metabolite transporter (DMT)-like permease
VSPAADSVGAGIPVTPLSANQRGILALIGGMCAYTVNDAMVKAIAQKYPIGEVIFVRGAMTTILIGATVLALGHAHDLRHIANKPVMIRSLFDGLSTACFVTALVYMKLAELAAMLQVAPLLLTAFSVLFLREVVGWRRWAAILVGFAGAMCVVKPTPAAFDIWALVALAAATSSALREMQTRRIERSVPTIVIAFAGSLGILVVGALFAAAGEWRPMAFEDLAMLAGAAVFVGLATYSIALAFRGVDISVVAPFRYSYLITSAIAGYLVFSELPDRWSALGAVLIVGSGLYALHREGVRRRELTATSRAAQ